MVPHSKLQSSAHLQYKSIKDSTIDRGNLKIGKLKLARPPELVDVEGLCVRISKSQVTVHYCLKKYKYCFHNFPPFHKNSGF
jgi:hypothetical protein